VEKSVYPLYQVRYWFWAFLFFMLMWVLGYSVRKYISIPFLGVFCFREEELTYLQIYDTTIITRDTESCKKPCTV